MAEEDAEEAPLLGEGVELAGVRVWAADGFAQGARLEVILGADELQVRSVVGPVARDALLVLASRAEAFIDLGERNVLEEDAGYGAALLRC